MILETRKFYLAHPYADESFIRVWQIKTQEKIDTQNINVFLYNPFYDSGMCYNQMFKDKLIGANEFPAEIIVPNDLNNIKTSDVLVAILLSYQRTIGTFMEVALAKIQNPDIKVYVVSPSEFVRTHIWVKYFSDKVFSRIADFENEILFKP